MLISDLIDLLNEILESEGDLEVMLDANDTRSSLKETMVISEDEDYSEEIEQNKRLLLVGYQ